MKKILQKEATVLRKHALEVPLEQIKSFRIKTILKEMRDALDSQDDGVAIAAPQIGHSLRIFIISNAIEEIIKDRKKSDVEGEAQKKSSITTVFINAKI